MQSRTAKIERDASPRYTESKRTAVKNSVTRRNSRKSERGEGGEGVKPSRQKAASRVTEFMDGPFRKVKIEAQAHEYQFVLIQVSVDGKHYVHLRYTKGIMVRQTIASVSAHGSSTSSRLFDIGNNYVFECGALQPKPRNYEIAYSVGLASTYLKP